MLYIPCPYLFRLKTRPRPVGAGVGVGPRLAGETDGLADGTGVGVPPALGPAQGGGPGVPPSLPPRLLSIEAGQLGSPGVTGSRPEQTSPQVRQTLADHGWPFRLSWAEGRIEVQLWQVARLRAGHTPSLPAGDASGTRQTTFRYRPHGESAGLKPVESGGSPRRYGRRPLSSLRPCSAAARRHRKRCRRGSQRDALLMSAHLDRPAKRQARTRSFLHLCSVRWNLINRPGAFLSNPPTDHQSQSPITSHSHRSPVNKTS